MSTTIRRRYRVVLLVFATILAVLAGGVAFAAATRDTGVGRHVGGPFAVGQAKGGGCRMGYDTETSSLLPPAVAAVVTITKPCAGAVVGRFTSETRTLNAGAFIDLTMQATCTGTGGFAKPCTVGETAEAEPGLTQFATNQEGYETHAMDMVWTGLLAGQWKFEVMPVGNNGAILEFRTFTVEAFNGG